MKIDMSRNLVYKAIKRKTRMSAMVHGNCKYSRKYLPETIVMADDKTLGIFVFKYKTYAQEWVDIWNGYHSFDGEKDLIVVPVIPIGRGRTLVWVCSHINAVSLNEFYKDDPTHRQLYGDAPDRTMGYPGVYVLE